VLLTIGMPVYDDFKGVFFTLQALRLYQDLTDCELLVVDTFGDDSLKKWMEYWTKDATYFRATENKGSAAAKNIIFEQATGDWVLCMDSHILLEKDAVNNLKGWIKENCDSSDLCQGPLLYDNGVAVSTHFEPVWRGDMWGIWSSPIPSTSLPSTAFEIPMQGAGVLVSRRSSWLRFNPSFTGFGGEEGYIHEKYRRAGRHVLCLPFLRWMHYFGKEGRGEAKYAVDLKDRIRNYIIGFRELGMTTQVIKDHFRLGML
jgi:glycosyltransferase involved in cell wall biosynthesis